VLAGITAVAGIGLLEGSHALAQSIPQPMKIKVGAIEVTVLSDGAMDLPTALMLPGREPSEIATVFKAAGQSFSGIRSQMNIAIVRTPSDIILIDAGGGPDFMPTLGKLHEQMTAAGFAPESITKIILTHAHPDHLWGVIDPLTDDTLFEKAEHVMTLAERDFWLQPDVDTRVAEAFKGMAAGTHRRLKSIAGRIKTAKAGEEVAAGLQLVDTGGHTPGHVSVLVRSGSEQLLIGSDVLTQSVVSFAQPEWRWGPDMDNDRAVASRRRVLDQLATNHMRLLGYHLPWPGLGHVERKAGAYRFVAS
jgi:glyoxylase-like metal-dependent hydrolase (beta-lactamase superfamily II)